jgi:AsmA family protein
MIGQPDLPGRNAMSWKKTMIVFAALTGLAILAVIWWITRYDYNRVKPLIAEQVRAATAREIDIEGDLRLKIRLAPTLTTGPIKLHNAAWGSKPNMLTAEAVEIQLSLLGLLQKKGVFKRLVLVKPVVLVEQSADGTKSNWEFDTPPAKDTPPPGTASNPLELALEYGEIKDGQLRLLNHHTGASTSLHIGNFVLEKKSGPLPLKTALEGTYNERAFSLEGRISFFIDLFFTSRDWDFDLALKDKRSELTLAGRLQRPAGDAPHRLEATLKGPQLDVRPWLAGPQETDAIVKKTARVFPNTPLPFDILHDLELQVDIDIQKLLMPHLALQNVKAPIQIKEGRLDLGPAHAAAGSGDYDAQIKIDARAKSPAVKATLKINQMNAGLMLKELGLSNMMEGVVDFQADLEAQGASIAKLMGSLNGHAMLVSGEGQLGKLFFGLFDEGIASQMMTLFNPLEGRSSMTPVECLVIRFDSAGGVAELSKMIWVTPDSIVVGGGRIDLSTEKIDIGIQPTPRQGKISLGILTKPFRLGGTLASPAMQIDPTATAMTVGRIAGGALFGPIGIAVAFTSIGDNVANPCLEAARTAEDGIVPREKGLIDSIGDKLRFWKKE